MIPISYILMMSYGYILLCIHLEDSRTWEIRFQPRQPFAVFHFRDTPGADFWEPPTWETPLCLESSGI